MYSSYSKIQDLHCHNGFYRGSAEVYSPQEAWSLARTRNMSAIGITNKVEFNHPKQDFIAFQRKQLDAWQSAREKRVFLGIELDLGDPEGTIVVKKENIKFLDYIIAGPHNMPVRSLTWSDLDDEDREEYFDVLKNMLINSFNNAPVTIWAHPFLQEIEFTAAKYENELWDIFLSVVDVCVKKNIALEINENLFRRTIPPKESMNWWSSDLEYYKEKVDFLEKMFKYALTETDLKFSFGSDTHYLKDVGLFPKSIDFAIKLAIPQERIFLINDN